MLKRIWVDESGSVNSAEIVLIVTLLSIGILVGMKSIRDSVVTEFADLGAALASLDQSYSYSSITVTYMIDGGTRTLSTAPSSFEDGPDFCDTSEDTDGGSPGSKCVNVCVAASDEGS